jgi:hypothetical protein
MVDTRNKRIMGVRRKLQIQQCSKQYYDAHKEEIKQVRKSYYEEHKDEIKAKILERKVKEGLDVSVNRKAYQHWYYENIRKKNKQDVDYKRDKDEVIKSMTFKVVVSRCPNDLVVYL